jgi:cytochrome bd-type quinol oxidase subunit 1
MLVIDGSLGFFLLAFVLLYFCTFSSLYYLFYKFIKKKKNKNKNNNTIVQYESGFFKFLRSFIDGEP